MRLALVAIPIALAMSSCVSPKSKEEIRGLSDVALFRELGRFLVQDHAAYRDDLISEASSRRKWKPEDVQRIRARRVWVGATDEQVIASWGKPETQDTQHDAQGRIDVWYYESYRNLRAVTLDNGVCAAVSDHDF